MSETDYDVAYQAALIALKDVHRPVLRRIVAEAVAGFIIGKGDRDARHWASLTADTPQKQRLVTALLRDLKRDHADTAIVSSGPVDAAVTAAATALLARSAA